MYVGREGFMLVAAFRPRRCSHAQHPQRPLPPIRPCRLETMRHRKLHPWDSTRSEVVFEPSSSRLTWGLPPCSWVLEAAPLQPRSNPPAPAPWNYSFTTPPGGVNQLQATTTQAMLSIPFSGSLNLALVTGLNLSMPVNGTYQGLVYSSVVGLAPTPQP